MANRYRPGKQKTITITLHLPPAYLEALNFLVKKAGLYPSVSEAIRVAIRNLIHQDLALLESNNGILVVSK